MKISIKIPQQDLLHNYSEEIQRWDWEGGRATAPSTGTLLDGMPLHPGDKFEVVSSNMAEEEGLFLGGVELHRIS